MKKLQACPGYVIVKRDAAQTKTESGIIIPEGQGKKPCRGVVTSVGPGRYMTPEGTPVSCLEKFEHIVETPDARHKTLTMNGVSGTIPPVIEGDAVVFSLYAGTEVEVGVDTFVVLKAEDILCRVVEE